MLTFQGVCLCQFQFHFFPLLVQNVTREQIILIWVVDVLLPRGAWHVARTMFEKYIFVAKSLQITIR